MEYLRKIYESDSFFISDVFQYNKGSLIRKFSNNDIDYGDISNWNTNNYINMEKSDANIILDIISPLFTGDINISRVDKKKGKGINKDWGWYNFFNSDKKQYIQCFKLNDDYWIISLNRKFGRFEYYICDSILGIKELVKLKLKEGLKL